VTLSEVIDVHLNIIVCITAVTLSEVIDVHMNTIRQTNAALMKPFSLSVFHNILSIVQTMHEKGWSHRDLHCELLLQKKQIRFLPSSGLQKSLSSLGYPNHGIQIIDTHENPKCTQFDLNTVLGYTRR
jgi:serine/threonine protein kinase